MPLHAPHRKPRRDTNATVYTFKVALANDGRTWRRIEVRSDQTLDHLHAAIFRAFNRFDEHLYSFFLGSGQPGNRKKLELTSPNSFEDVGQRDSTPILDASRFPIGELRLAPGDRFKYLFDFGDEWWHDVTAERCDGQPAQARYPRVVEKHGASPPQYVYEQ